jgi:trehalose synthase
MTVLTSVPVAALPIERFASVLDAEAYERFDELAGGARERFAGRVVWNVNSTPRGGGVAEMLQLPPGCAPADRPPRSMPAAITR